MCGITDFPKWNQTGRLIGGCCHQIIKKNKQKSAKLRVKKSTIPGSLCHLRPSLIITTSAAEKSKLFTNLPTGRNELPFRFFFGTEE